MEIDKKWAGGKKYLDMGEYLEWREMQATTALSKVIRVGWFISLTVGNLHTKMNLILWQSGTMMVTQSTGMKWIKLQIDLCREFTVVSWRR
ncbi:hypothetical protein QO009_004177 [Brevibacillus aydinogluensis]|jgi:hypothetical protein|uniref:Uncharacterized protein n=1 Tax=Brevibacillus aydinogluensis TaxID=927786 RepID=A0AA48MC83_9BACL|nr:hypothetical protein [Brevibacillus aydinogluensis]CAJ1003824.1 hypothetical protein BSPP4475_15990 [Brevibacillus aydinogluensis]